MVDIKSLNPLESIGHIDEVECGVHLGLVGSLKNIVRTDMIDLIVPNDYLSTTIRSWEWFDSGRGKGMNGKGEIIELIDRSVSRDD